MTITYALMQAYEKLCESGDKATLYNKARVDKLLTSASGVSGPCSIWVILLDMQLSVAPDMANGCTVKLWQQACVWRQSFPSD